MPLCGVAPLLVVGAGCSSAWLWVMAVVEGPREPSTPRRGRCGTSYGSGVKKVRPVRRQQDLLLLTHVVPEPPSVPKICIVVSL